MDYAVSYGAIALNHILLAGRPFQNLLTFPAESGHAWGNPHERVRKACMPKEIKRSTNPLLALVLAWLVPGAGHFYLGRPVRGAIIFVVIGATFWVGVAVGGVLTVDYYNSRGWFVAQMCTGAHGLYGWHRQKNVYEPVFTDIAEKMKDSNPKITTQGVISLFMLGTSESRDSANPGTIRDAVLVVGEVDAALQKQGVAMLYPTENVARAYSGVAGMLNLLCIIDAMVLSFMGTYGEPEPSDAAPTREAA
jgi:TM2 domain-containing membrane protein YozV